MNSDDFESKLGRQPMRPIPADWRREILHACSVAEATTPSPPHPSAAWWRQWLWPCPQAWGALAAVWVLILALHFSSTPSPPPTHVNFARVQWLEFQQQQESLARLLSPPEPAEPPKSPSHAQITHPDPSQLLATEHLKGPLPSPRWALGSATVPVAVSGVSPDTFPQIPPNPPNPAARDLIHDDQKLA